MGCVFSFTSLNTVLMDCMDERVRRYKTRHNLKG